MPGRAKVLGSRLTRICFFFQMENILFQKNCRQIMSVFLRAFFLCFSVSFTPNIVILITLTSYFPCFLFHLKNFPRPKLMGRLRNNSICSSPVCTFQVGCMLTISLFKFHFVFLFGKFFNFLQEFQLF